MSDDNVFADEWDPRRRLVRRGGARSKRLPRGEHLGATVYELGPGTWVGFHFHHASEELLVVLGGRPTLRGPTAADSSSPVRSSTFLRVPLECTNQSRPSPV